MPDVKNNAETQIDDICGLYAAAYGDSGMLPDQIFDEILCDAMGEMNAFATEGQEKVAGAVGLFLRDVARVEKNVQTNKGKSSNRLTNEDLDGYLRAGGRANIWKSRNIADGKDVILTSENQIENYILDSINGNTANIGTAAYGIVNDRLADDVLRYSDNSIDIRGDYLELVPDDLLHAYSQHLLAKEEGDIDLTDDDFLNIPEYVDNYDELVYARKFKSGATHLAVSKKTDGGRVVIVEVVSKSHGSIVFKNMIGVTEEKYQNDTLPRLGQKIRAI